MRVTYTEVNGRKYAYTCTSKRVPGKTNPVSKRSYLGVVDPETGRIIPKKGSEGSWLNIMTSRIKNHGDVAIVLYLAERLTIREDLRKVFGEDADRLLAIVLAQAIRPSSSNNVSHTFDTSSVCESVGLDPRMMGESEIRRLMNRISSKSMDEFFKRRFNRDPETLLVFNHSMSLVDESEDILHSIPSVLVKDEVCVTIWVTCDGNPVGFKTIGNPGEDVSDLVDLMGRLRETIGDCVFVSDTVLSPTLRISELVRNKVEFMAPYPITSEQYASVIRDYTDLMDDRYALDGPSGMGFMKESSVGLSMASDGSVVIPESDSRFNACGAHLRSYVSIDPVARDDALRTVNRIVRSVRQRLNGQISSDPQALLRNVAGPTCPLFRASVNDDGIMRVTVRKNIMDNFRNNAGKTLVLTTSASWNDAMVARALRKGIKDVMWQYRGGSDWAFKNVGRGVDMQSQMFVEFIVLTIYSEMRNILIDNGLKTDIPEILHRASSVKSVMAGPRLRVGPIDRRTRRILDLFGVEFQEDRAD